MFIRHTLTTVSLMSGLLASAAFAQDEQPPAAPPEPNEPVNLPPAALPAQAERPPVAPLGPSEPMVIPPHQPVKVSWDGGTVVEFDNASIVLTNKIWALFLAQMPDDNSILGPSEPGAMSPDLGQARGSFLIRKAESTVEGFLYDKTITYEFELAYRDPSGILNHAMIDWDPTAQGLFQLRFGQFKAPFGRQELTSSERLQFVNRSIISEEYEAGEDVGLMLHGGLFDGQIDWGVGMFNGNGKNKAANDNRNFLYNARVTYQPWGDVKYSEADFESTDHPLVAISLDFEHNDRRGATLDVDAKRVVFGADLAFKYAGLSFFAEGFYRKLTPEKSSGQASYLSPGAWVQSGYFVYQRKLELAARYAAWDPNSDVAGDLRDETGVAFNFYAHGHLLKLQTDFRMLRDNAADTTDFEARLQTVVWF
jgi:hypothetical protein